MVDTDCMSTTEQEAYAMSVSIALNTLNDLMLDEDTPLEYKLWSAEAVLDHNPTLDHEKTDEDDEQD